MVVNGHVDHLFLVVFGAKVALQGAFWEFVTSFCFATRIAYALFVLSMHALGVTLCNGLGIATYKELITDKNKV